MWVKSGFFFLFLGFGVQGLTSKETDFKCFGSLAAAWHHSSLSLFV